MHIPTLRQLTVASALGLLPTAVEAAGFQCDWRPVADAPVGAGNIKDILPTGSALDDPTQLNTVIDILRKRGLSKLLIADNIIAAYCSSVAANGELSDREKTARVQRFAMRVTQTVYANDVADKIILDVTLPPDVADAIQAKAKAVGMTAQEWIAKTATVAVKGTP